MAYDQAGVSAVDATLQLYKALETQRSNWLTDWIEVADLIDPQAVRRSEVSTTEGSQSRNKIIDSTATQALGVLRAGLMSGATSPARPWVRLTLEDDDLLAYEPVQEWLSVETQRLLKVFRRSNTYTMLMMVYTHLGLVGSTCAVTMPRFEDVIAHYVSPLGEFCLGADFLGSVDTVARRFQKTVHEVVKEFGLENCSQTVQNMYSKGNYYAQVPIVHVISPRREYDATKKNAKNKPWKSCYVEDGNHNGRYLRESGYDDFPALCPRWDRRSGDVYGTGPGLYARGDIKQLQHEQLFKARAIEYMVNPPVQAPTSFRDNEMDMLPGGMNFVDMNTPSARIQSIYDVNINLNNLLEDIYDVRNRIESAFHKPVFAMFADMERTGQMTATEVAERHEEKMLMLGPVVERMHNELLRPLVENTIARMIQVGMVSEPPEELQGRELEIEFVSTLAQAQKAVGINSTDRFVNSIGVVAQMKPEVLDKFDADAWADRVSDSMGVDPKMIIGSERVGLIRQARMEQQMREQQLASVMAQAEAAAKLGTVKTNEQNAATDILNMFQGYGSPSGVEV